MLTAEEYIRSQISNSARRVTIKTAARFAEEYHQYRIITPSLKDDKYRSSIELLEEFLRETPKEELDKIFKRPEPTLFEKIENWWKRNIVTEGDE